MFFQDLDAVLLVNEYLYNVLIESVLLNLSVLLISHFESAHPQRLHYRLQVLYLADWCG